MSSSPPDAINQGRRAPAPVEASWPVDELAVVAAAPFDEAFVLSATVVEVVEEVVEVAAAVVVVVEATVVVVDAVVVLVVVLVGEAVPTAGPEPIKTMRTMQVEATSGPTTRVVANFRPLNSFMPVLRERRRARYYGRCGDPQVGRLAIPQVGRLRCCFFTPQNHPRRTTSW
jgi:hypothetical protein